MWPLSTFVLNGEKKNRMKEKTHINCDVIHEKGNNFICFRCLGPLFLITCTCACAPNNARHFCFCLCHFVWWWCGTYRMRDRARSKRQLHTWHSLNGFFFSFRKGKNLIRIRIKMRRSRIFTLLLFLKLPLDRAPGLRVLWGLHWKCKCDSNIPFHHSSPPRF